MKYLGRINEYVLYIVDVDDAGEVGVCGSYAPGTVLVYQATALPVIGCEIAVARDEAEAEYIVGQMIVGTNVSSFDWRCGVAKRTADAINGNQD